MATSWRDILPRIIAERDGLAVSSVSSVRSADVSAEAPNGPNGPNGEVAAAMTAGVQRLRLMRCPSGIDDAAWHRAAIDAGRLLDEDWVEKALALGWSPLDLFGCVPDQHGNPAGDGLAVWLAGRKLLALTADYAVADDGGGARSYFNRRVADGAVLLWALGRGR